MEEREIFETVKERLIACLSAKNLRKTPERFAILEQIYMHNTHFDVETLYDIMMHSGYRVSRATVYNTVDLLVDCQLIRKHQFGTGVAHYEAAFTEDKHHHMICTRCHSVTELRDDELQQYITAKEFGSFTLESFNLYLYGLCENCQLVDGPTSQIHN